MPTEKSSKPKSFEERVTEKKIKLHERTIARLTKQRDSAQGRLGSLLSDFKASLRERDHLNGVLAEGRIALDLMRKRAATAARERDHLQALFEAMVQRYVGTKLDTQQFTFLQARQFLDNEWGSLGAALAQIREQVESEHHDNGCMARVEQEAA
jgi:hypothetical protein